MDVDMTPLMNWNTHTIFATLVCEFTTETSAQNSVTVWDQRITRANKDHHHVSLSNEHVEYYLTDINKELKGTEVKVFLRWEHMSTIGSYYGDQTEVASFYVPKKYSGNSKRYYTPGPTSRTLNY